MAVQWAVKLLGVAPEFTFLTFQFFCDIFFAFSNIFHTMLIHRKFSDIVAPFVIDCFVAMICTICYHLPTKPRHNDI